MRFASLFLLALGAGCTSFSVSGGPVRSDGTVGAYGTKSGYEGAAIDVGGSHAFTGGRSELGAFVTADMAGYVDDYDGDGIKWVGLSVRYRRYLGTGGLAPFVAIGGGPGIGGGYGNNDLVLEGFAELGVRYSLGSHTALTLGLRERPAAFIGTYTEAHNTLEAAVGLEIRPWGGGPSARRAEPALATR